MAVVSVEDLVGAEVKHSEFEALMERITQAKKSVEKITQELVEIEKNSIYEDEQQKQNRAIMVSKKAEELEKEIGTASTVLAVVRLKEEYPDYFGSMPDRMYEICRSAVSGRKTAVRADTKIFDLMLEVKNFGEAQLFLAEERVVQAEQEAEKASAALTDVRLSQLDVSIDLGNGLYRTVGGCILDKEGNSYAKNEQGVFYNLDTNEVYNTAKVVKEPEEINANENTESNSKQNIV